MHQNLISCLINPLILQSNVQQELSTFLLNLPQMSMNARQESIVVARDAKTLLEVTVVHVVRATDLALMAKLAKVQSLI